MTFNLRPRQPIDYRLLNSGENIRLESSIIIIRPVLDEPFFVERLIWKRKDQERSVSILSFSLTLISLSKEHPFGAIYYLSY